MTRYAPLYIAAVCAATAAGLATAPAVGLAAAAVMFVGLWWLTLEEVDDANPS